MFVTIHNCTWNVVTHVTQLAVVDQLRMLFISRGSLSQLWSFMSILSLNLHLRWRTAGTGGCLSCGWYTVFFSVGGGTAEAAREGRLRLWRLHTLRPVSHSSHVTGRGSSVPWLWYRCSHSPLRVMQIITPKSSIRPFHPFSHYTLCRYQKEENKSTALSEGF